MMKIGSVLSHVRVDAARPGLIFGRALFGNRERRGPDVSLGGGTNGSSGDVRVGFVGGDCVDVDA